MRKNQLLFPKGKRKHAFACKVGIPAIGIGGVWNWKEPKSEPDKLLADFRNKKGFPAPSSAELVFDSDVDTNPNVRLALARFAKALEAVGLKVKVVYLPSGKNGEKVGLDDYLVEGGTKSNGEFSEKKALKAFKKLPRHDPPEIDPIRVRSAVDIQPKPLRPILVES